MPMQGFTMKFPIIKIRNKDTGYERIVGTDSHDTLSIHNGEMQYYNLQNGEGTGERSCYELVGEISEYSPYAKIEFVTFEELLEIYKEHVDLAAENERQIRETMDSTIDKYLEEIKKSREEGFSIHKRRNDRYAYDKG